MPILEPRTRVKICYAVSSKSEPYIGKLGSIIRCAKGCMEGMYFVKIDGSDAEHSFYSQELKTID